MSGTTCISSGLLTADASIYKGRGTLNAIIVMSDGTNDATLTLYDNSSSATGVVLHKMIAPAGFGTRTDTFNLAVRCLEGIYADISGTGASYIVYYGA